MYKPPIFLHAACSAQVKAKIPNPKDLEGKLAHGGAHSQVFFKTNTKLVDDKGNLTARYFTNHSNF